MVKLACTYIADVTDLSGGQFVSVHVSKVLKGSMLINLEILTSVSFF